MILRSNIGFATDCRTFLVTAAGGLVRTNREKSLFPNRLLIRTWVEAKSTLSVASKK
jgi:hypothetical protein